jgi:hypothetical protein
MKIILKASIILSALICAALCNAQLPTSSEVYKTLKKNDSLIFDSAFNDCKMSDLNDLISEDLEFYHDTGGITNGKEEFLKTVQQNICGNPSVRPYRELVKGSLQVFPLTKNGTLYGAIQKGDHNFYLKENGETRPTVTAKFTHLWILEQKKWTLKRVLSYDHQPIQH